MKILVVGAGLAGLTAARDLVSAGHDVVVLEGATEIGGKLRRREVAGVVVDVGAEAMLNRRPEGVELAGSLGLEVVHPTDASSRIWTRGALRPLPRTLMGAPLDLDQLAGSGVLSDDGLERARHERVGPVEGDVTVGDLIDARFGSEVTDRLVEPLLGGVYAGRAREISARAAVPQLVALAERGSITAQADALATAADVPVFAGLAGGMGGLVEALADGLDVRTGVQVRELRRAGGGFEARFARTSTTGTAAARTSTTGTAAGRTSTTGTAAARTSTTGAAAGRTSTTAGGQVRADAVVLATPAAPTARLLGDLAPEAARDLAEIEYASMAVVTLALRAADAPRLAETTASGFLVPPVDRRRIKAATFSFSKWHWLREAGAAHGLLLLRTSLGRHGEVGALQVSDDDLVAASLADLAAATGLRAQPVATHVQRWGGGLPQYAVGHLDRVARIRADVVRVPGLAVAGAAYEGVGIPAVIASGHRAAAEVDPG